MSEKSEDLSCEDTKEYMKLFYNLGFFWVQIIFLIIMYIFTYSLSRWFFWTRSWGSWENKPGRIWGVAQFFIFIMFMGVIFGLIAPILGIINIIKKFIPGPSGPLQFIFRICIKIMQVSTVIFPIFGFLSIIKGIGRGLFGRKGAICPIKLDSYFTYLKEKIVNIKDGTDRIEELYKIVKKGAYIYLEDMNENEDFTKNLFETLNISDNTNKIKFLNKFRKKGFNPFTFYVNDPNSKILKKKAAAADNKPPATTAEQPASEAQLDAKVGGGDLDNAEAIALMVENGENDGKSLSAKWMSNVKGAKINGTLENAFNGKNNHKFSCCGITIHSFSPGLNWIPGFSRSNLYGASIIMDSKIEAGVRGGCTPCNMFGFVLNYFLKSGGALLKLLAILSVLFLLLSFIFWLKWWFGCWGWAEAEENKDEEQQDRKENNIPLKKIDLMRNESNIKYKNGNSGLKSYAKWVKEWEKDSDDAVKKRKQEFETEPIPPPKKEQQNELKLVKNNKLVELFISDGPEAQDSWNKNDEPAMQEWKKFADGKAGKALGSGLTSNFTSIFTTF